MLTRRCNMACSHCSVESGPKVRSDPSDADVFKLVQSAADAGVRSIQLTGGEPMLREKLVLEILKLARTRGIVCTMSTNGFWGRNPATAWRKVRVLRKLGLARMTVSYDRYHAEFQGPEPALNIAAAAEWFDLPININITRVANDPELAGLVAPFEKLHQLKMRFYDVQVIGRARSLPIAEIRGETRGFCQAATSPAITEDGRMTACNGPAYFQAKQSPLHIGSLHESSIHVLMAKHADDAILETIRCAGPSRLLRELEAAGVANDLGIRQQHSGLCDLCLDINSNPAAVAVLRERLSQEKYRAELAATRMVIRTAHASGELRIDYVNGIGAAKVWLDASAGRVQRWEAAAEKIFGRADFDWNRSADYLIACGLSRALTPLLDSPELRRWAPSFFAQRLKKAALREGLRDLSQRESIRHIGDSLARLGARGVLLKGGALLGREAFGEARPGKVVRRAAGDIDVVVPASVAGALRDDLLANGYSGDRTATRTGPHHLAPITRNGVTVEIHTRIMPEFWGLPESAMLEFARPLAGIPSLATLDDEGMILHAGVHSTAHLFSHGIRGAWDISWLMERGDGLDVERLLRWIDRLSMPRSFWVPARLFSRGLVDLPPSLMSSAPADERQRKIERVAEVRLFSAIEGAFDLNPFSKNGLFLMLHDSWTSRARHAASLFGKEERESRRSAATSARLRNPSGASSALAVQLREGMMHWRQFQRAVSR